MEREFFKQQKVEAKALPYNTDILLLLYFSLSMEMQEGQNSTSVIFVPPASSIRPVTKETLRKCSQAELQTASILNMKIIKIGPLVGDTPKTTHFEYSGQS